MSAAIPFRSINLRAELRLALLAAAESCWLYAIVLTIGVIAGFPRVISPLGIFVVYWLGLVVGRLLPRLPHAWRTLQIASVICAVLIILLAMRVGFYDEFALTSPLWLSNYFENGLAFFQRFTGEQISTLVLILAYMRALGFAQRPLTLWVIGFQFRLGIVIFFALAIIAAFAGRVDFIFWIFMFFAFSLLGIALARIEEAGQTSPLDARWTVVMFTMLAATLLVGFALTRFLTLDALNAFIAFLSPVFLVLQIIFFILALPFFILTEFLIRLLIPLFNLLANAFSKMIPTIPQTNIETVPILESVTRSFETLMPYLRLAGVVLVLVVIGWVIARALNRRMNREEEEMFLREKAPRLEREYLAERERDRRKRDLLNREVHAENVRRIYAALQAQAEALGLPRRAAETPLEFLPRLTARFPGSAANLEKITNEYVAVHYAQQQASDAQVRELRDVWKKTKEEMKQAGA